MFFTAIIIITSTRTAPLFFSTYLNISISNQKKRQSTSRFSYICPAYLYRPPESFQRYLIRNIRSRRNSSTPFPNLPTPHIYPPPIRYFRNRKLE